MYGTASALSHTLYLRRSPAGAAQANLQAPLSYLPQMRPSLPLVSSWSDAYARAWRYVMTEGSVPLPADPSPNAAAKPTRTGEPVLRMTGVSKSFGAVQALQGVDFEVYAGEVVGL